MCPNVERRLSFRTAAFLYDKRENYELFMSLIIARLSASRFDTNNISPQIWYVKDLTKFFYKDYVKFFTDKKRRKIRRFLSAKAAYSFAILAFAARLACLGFARRLGAGSVLLVLCHCLSSLSD